MSDKTETSVVLGISELSSKCMLLEGRILRAEKDIAKSEELYNNLSSTFNTLTTTVEVLKNSVDTLNVTISQQQQQNIDLNAGLLKLASSLQRIDMETKTNTQTRAVTSDSNIQLRITVISGIIIFLFTLGVGNIIGTNTANKKMMESNNYTVERVIDIE